MQWASLSISLMLWQNNLECCVSIHWYYASLRFWSGAPPFAICIFVLLASLTNIRLGKNMTTKLFSLLFMSLYSKLSPIFIDCFMTYMRITLLYLKVKYLITLANIRLGQKQGQKYFSLSLTFHYNKLACFSLAPSLTFKSKAGVSH